MRPDIVVIGGGTVGAAIAYGLARKQEKVLLLDGDDGDFRAARRISDWSGCRARAWACRPTRP